jgi:ubiquinone/menaquinone biosynthesis C-methylase UbiE
MSQRENSRQEHPSTYVVQDRSNREELARLQLQDDLMTQGMGGVLPEQPDPASLRRVLDVGCGTGGWLIETARSYPSISLLIGVDISRTYVEYARTQAEAARVSDRVEFHVMDALRMLEFPNKFFDLVNHRLATSWLRTWDWPKLLQEYQRVCRPKGVVRITEGDWTAARNSVALSRLFDLSVKALSQAGHLFTPTGSGVTGQLVRLLKQHGLQQVQTRAFTLEYRAGTPAGQHYFEDNRLAFRTMLPFLRKWTHVPAEYESIYQQALVEMQQPDFVATWNMLTAWGVVPPRRQERADAPS